MWHRSRHRAVTGLAASEATVGKVEEAGCGHTGVELRGWNRSVI